MIGCCTQNNVGGADSVTAPEQFMANVKHLSAQAEESIGGSVPVTNSSGKGPSEATLQCTR